MPTSVPLTSKQQPRQHLKPSDTFPAFTIRAGIDALGATALEQDLILVSLNLPTESDKKITSHCGRS